MIKHESISFSILNDTLKHCSFCWGVCLHRRLYASVYTVQYGPVHVHNHLWLAMSEAHPSNTLAWHLMQSLPQQVRVLRLLLPPVSTETCPVGCDCP